MACHGVGSVGVGSVGVGSVEFDNASILFLCILLVLGNKYIPNILSLAMLRACLPTIATCIIPKSNNLG